MLNILEAFFRRPILHLLPLVLMLILAVATVVAGGQGVPGRRHAERHQHVLAR